MNDLELACTGTWGDYKTYSVVIDLKKGDNNITLWKIGTEVQGANIKTVTIEGKNPQTGDASMIVAAAAAMAVSAAALVLLKKKEEEQV